MNRKLTISITLLFLLALSLVLVGCQNPLASILQRPPAETEEAVVATEEPTPPVTAPAPTETKPVATVTEEPSSTATPTAATEEPTEPTEEPAASAEAAAFEPLTEDNCAHITEILSTAFGVEFRTEEVDFQDFLTGETGKGCAAQAEGDGSDFDSPGAVAQTVGQQLEVEGWAPEVQYAADGPTGTVMGFRKENSLCILEANWTPSEDADCATDKPISECKLMPKQQLFDVILTCAQHSEEEVTGMATGAESETAPTEAASPTPSPGELPEVTVQAPPAPMPPPEQARRIEFPPGGTSATIEGSVGVGGVDFYVLRAMAGQTMSVDLSSPKGNAVIAIWGADGVVLLSDRAGARNWSGPLSSNQDYYISVSAVAGTSTSYTLSVAVSAAPVQPTPTVVPPQPTPTPDLQAIRIEFAPGTDAATVAGSTPAGGIARFVIRAQAQQTLSVNVVSATGSVIMVIWGADGTVLISDHAGATSWSGLLPLTQDYFIDVIAAAGAPTNFTLQVVIPPMPGPMPEPTTKRISFATGSISATEPGTVPPGGMMRYLVGAMTNQTMSVNLNSPQGTAILVIWGADGTVLLSDHAGGTSWSGILPASQDYIIDVKSIGTAPTNFTLQVTIPLL